MAHLLVYRWEHDKFPKEQKINIPYPERKFLPHILAKKFNLHNISVAFVFRKANKGDATSSTWSARIRLPKLDVPCSLGVIYHELAHVLNTQKFKDDKDYHPGHKGSFKRALIKVYIDSDRLYITDARAEAEQAIATWRAEREAKEIKAQKILDRKAKLKEMRRTLEYRVDQTRKRVKSLEMRVKRLQTALKKAKHVLLVREGHLARRRQAKETIEQPCQNTNLVLAETVVS